MESFTVQPYITHDTTISLYRNLLYHSGSNSNMENFQCDSAANPPQACMYHLSGKLMHHQPPGSVTNFLSYTLTLICGFSIFYGMLIECWVHEKNVLQYERVYLTVMLQMCVLYTFEMLTKQGITWLNYAHHFMACVGGCVIFDFTDTTEERYFYMIYVGYVMTDLFLYGSLFVYEAKRCMDPPSPAHCKLALCLTRLSIASQAIATWWNDINAFYKVGFIAADPIWVTEQFYVLHRSVLSAEKQLALGESKLTVVETLLKHATKWTNQIANLRRSKNPPSVNSHQGEPTTPKEDIPKLEELCCSDSLENVVNDVSV